MKRKLYSIALCSVHAIGILFIAASCLARAIFYHDWPIEDELLAWGLFALVYIFHATLLFVGYKYDRVNSRAVKVLRITEYIVMAWPILFIIVFGFPYYKFSFGQIFPLVITDLLIVVIGWLRTHFCRKHSAVSQT
jgi:hypothetical protein